jgi:hypothetical protein
MLDAAIPTEIRRLCVEEKLKPREIAIRLGVSYPTVLKYLLNFGLRAPRKALGFPDSVLPPVRSSARLMVVLDGEELSLQEVIELRDMLDAYIRRHSPDDMRSIDNQTLVRQLMSPPKRKATC